MLDALPASDSVVLLTKADGKPWDLKGDGLRNAFREACRGTFITRRRAMSWTAEETAPCSGHKVKGKEGAQSAYVDRLTVAIAKAERLWARYYGPNEEQMLQTGKKKATPKGG